MKIKVPLLRGEGSIQEIQETYKYTENTGYGHITFALVNEGKESFHKWCIVEYTTGLCVLSDTGKLTKERFIRFSKYIINLNPKKLKENIDKQEKIN